MNCELPDYPALKSWQRYAATTPDEEWRVEIAGMDRAGRFCVGVGPGPAQHKRYNAPEDPPPYRTLRNIKQECVWDTVQETLHAVSGRKYDLCKRWGTITADEIEIIDCNALRTALRVPPVPVAVQAKKPKPTGMWGISANIKTPEGPMTGIFQNVAGTNMEDAMQLFKAKYPQSEFTNINFVGPIDVIA